MKKKTITGLALIGVLLVTGIAIAQPAGNMGNRQMGNRGGNGGGRGDFFQIMRPLMNVLDLTDQQRESVATIIADAKDSIEELHGDEGRENHREEFINLFSSSSLSVTEMESLMNSRMDQMEETNSIIAQALVDIHDLLTSEQLQKLAEFDPSSMEREHGEHGSGGRMNMGVHPNR